MQIGQTLVLSASGQDYVFTENESVLKYLQKIYLNMNFEVSLSLNNYGGRNLHQLIVEYPYALDIKFNHPYVCEAILDALLNYLDSVQEEMYRTGVKSSTVILNRIDVGTYVDHILLKSKVFANLRAVFIPNK